MRNHITPDDGTLSGPSIDTGPGIGHADRIRHLERGHDAHGGDVSNTPARPPGTSVSPTSDFEGFGSFS
jgi:hypothetical protein